MKIKKEFLNETSLKPYGIKKEPEDRYWWPNYTTKGEYPNPYLMISGRNGEIMFVIPSACDCDCDSIPDALYHLIKDGLVEL